jgi:hypothetical protein
LASADSHLPFQDWRWLVTRPVEVEKSIVVPNRKVLRRAIVIATSGCGRTKVTAI